MEYREPEMKVTDGTPPAISRRPPYSDVQVAQPRPKVRETIVIEDDTIISKGDVVRVKKSMKLATVKKACPKSLVVVYGEGRRPYRYKYDEVIKVMID